MPHSSRSSSIMTPMLQKNNHLAEIKSTVTSMSPDQWHPMRHSRAQRSIPHPQGRHRMASPCAPLYAERAARQSNRCCALECSAGQAKGRCAPTPANRADPDAFECRHPPGGTPSQQEARGRRQRDKYAKTANARCRLLQEPGRVSTVLRFGVTREREDGW